jgi:hypothetical protein
MTLPLEALRHLLVRRTQATACVFTIMLSGLLLGAILVPHPALALTVTPRLELNAEAGTALETKIKVSNEQRASQTVYLKFANFNAQDENGTPTFSDRQEDLAVWLAGPASVTVGPGETKEVPIRINIPADASPGGHFAAVFFLSEPPGGAAEGAQVSISSELGSLILLRVGGEFDQAANILEFQTVGKKHFWTQLPIGFYYRFQDTGDDHLKPLGDVQITNTFGRVTKILPANTIDGSVLPKSVRRFQTVWTQSGGPLKQEPVTDMPDQQKLGFWSTAKYQAGHLAIGRYTATLKLAFGTKGLQSARSAVVFYIIPWQLLAVAIPALIVLLILAYFGIKRYNRYILRRAGAQKPAVSRARRKK